MRRIPGLVVISIIGWGLLMLVACCFPAYVEEPYAPAGHRGTYYYDYYPDPGVYYDRGRNIYFYHDEGHWKESPSLPPAYHVDRNNHRELHLDTDKPYNYHSDVNKQYPPGQQKKTGRD
jgi:hypothetical protein